MCMIRRSDFFIDKAIKIINAPDGIRTRVVGCFQPKILNDFQLRKSEMIGRTTLPEHEPAETFMLLQFELGTTGSLRANHPNMDDGHIRPALHQAKLRAHCILSEQSLIYKDCGI